MSQEYLQCPDGRRSTQSSDLVYSVSQSLYNLSQLSLWTLILNNLKRQGKFAAQVTVSCYALHRSLCNGISRGLQGWLNSTSADANCRAHSMDLRNV